MAIVCFDIGGTYIKYGLFEKNGELIFVDKFATPFFDAKESIPKILIKYIEKLRISYDLTVVGISSAGTIDSDKGVVTYANQNLSDYTDCRLADTISCQTNLDVFVENDGYCAALGELNYGAGKKLTSFFCLTLGTGVGGAVILNRKLYKGFRGHAGACHYNKIYGKTLEETASTRRLLESYQSIAGNMVDGVEFFELVKQKDPKALCVYDQFLDYLVDGILNIVYLYDPQAVIIGGGISSQGDSLFKDINDRFQKHCHSNYSKISIIKAELENTAGLLGACSIIQNQNYVL